MERRRGYERALADNNISVKDEAEIAILRLEREGRLYNG